jgi:CMP-N-acetylneuraminic acid synthetase
MRLDADDYLHPSAVSKLAAALAADPSTVLAFPDYFEIDARGSVIRRVKRHDFNALGAMSDLPAHGACTMIRRSFLASFGDYDESIDRQDGLDVWLNVSDEQHVISVSEPLFFYRRHGDSLTSNERALLQARAKLISKHVARRALPRPRVIALIPVRGQLIDSGSLPLQTLGDRALVDWTVDEALSCDAVDRVVASSPDDRVLDHLRNRYGQSVATHRRDLELAGINVSLAQTVRAVLQAERESGRTYDALLILTIESPFRSSIYMQQAVQVSQLFATDATIGARHEDEAFYQHDGLGLHPVRQDDRMRLEREDLFRGCGGLRLVALRPDGDPDDYLAAADGHPERLGHVLVDQLAAFTIRTSLDWQIARYLVAVGAHL